jgi:hypothetical protein
MMRVRIVNPDGTTVAEYAAGGDGTSTSSSSSTESGGTRVAARAERDQDIARAVLRVGDDAFGSLPPGHAGTDWQAADVRHGAV